jgi:peptide/nickel transport system substrate-binding protein
MKRRRLLASSLALVALVAGACGGGQTGSTTSPKPAAGGTLTIDNESGSLWTCNFNPLNASINGAGLSFGSVYEPLVYDNLLTDKRTPMLASAYSWSADNKTLTFTVRSGVKWSDGQPFSAADVLYTFNLIKQKTALDLQSVWTVLSSVTQEGTDKVSMTFTQSAVPYFYEIAGQVPIVPQHIWSNIADPVAYGDPTTWPGSASDTAPVGTGPFTVGQCTPQNVTFTRNPTYWQPGLPHLQTVNYPAFTDNDPANQFLAQGQAQWGGQFIPNIDTYYVAKDKAHYHYWFPPIQNNNIWFNFTRPPLDNKAVRQAFAFAIDRASVSQKGEYGYEPAGNQSGVITPTFSSWIDQAQQAKYGYKFDTNKAASLLQGAGFTKNSSGIFASSSGKPLSFTIITIAGYTDWDASLQVVAANLKQAGINLTVKDQSYNDYTNNLFTGNYDLAYGAVLTSVGPSPYYELRNTLYSATTADIGQTAAGDYGRYKNPAIDTLFDQYGATTDSAKQHKLMSQIEGFILEDVPIVPVDEGVAWYQYNTKDFAGWPTKDDPYAAPAPWNTPDWEIVLLHLYKTS